MCLDRIKCSVLYHCCQVKISHNERVSFLGIKMRMIIFLPLLSSFKRCIAIQQLVFAKKFRKCHFLVKWNMCTHIILDTFTQSPLLFKQETRVQGCLCCGVPGAAQLSSVPYNSLTGHHTSDCSLTPVRT